MDSPTQFWGVEVKAGQTVKVDPNDEFEGYIHISQVALGEVKKDKAIEPVVLYLKVDDKKFVVGTLIKGDIPQIAMDLVLERESELSHNSKSATIYFSGYKVYNVDDSEEDSDLSDSDHELAPLRERAQAAKEAAKSGKPAAETGAVPKQVKIVDPTTNKIVDPTTNKIVDPNEVEDDSEDESDDDFSGEDDIAISEEIDTDTDSDSGSESDEETPAKKVDQGNKNKRPNESASKATVPTKKAKNATPEKTDGKKVVHIATPHPMKKGGNTPKGGNTLKGAAKGQSPNSNKSGASKAGQQSKKFKQGGRR